MATLTSKDQSTTPSTSSQDDYLKRNTDCVYFLASPLTCKKGSECEYRHSEYARLNPRDCIYWMSGNCLNPKCAFRHPPLDGLVGAQTGTFTGPSVPGPPTPVAPVNPHTAAMQAVPCIFFQKGYCLKGDRCPFLHGPVPASAKVPQVSAITPATQPPSVKPTFGGLEKCTQPKVNIHTNASRKVVEKPVQINAIPKVEISQPRNGASSGRRGPVPNALSEESPIYKETIVPPIDNGSSRFRSVHVPRASSLDDPNFQYGRDGDDTLRESSPGFDVLVDDKLRDDEYYENEDHFVRMRARDGRNLNEFEMNRYDDYDSVVDADSDLYHNRRGYDSYDHMQERYAREQHRGSSERSPGEPTQYDRRGSYKSESNDLRQRLSKERRVNGLKSIVNPDYNRDNHRVDRSYRTSHRETHHSPTHESSRSRSNRLEGRIKLPRRSPPLGGGNLYSERGHGSGRNRGRSSPTRPLVASQQGRLRDRLRVNEDSNEGRTSRGYGMRRESFDENNGSFAAPKSLAELKGKFRDTVIASSVVHEGDLSFDGPKPLSEILKRKRDTGISVSTGNEENKQNRNNEEDSTKSNADYSAADIKKQVSVNSEPEQAPGTKVENKAVKGEGDDKEEVEVSNKKMKMAEGEEGSIKEQPDIEEGLNNVNQGDEVGDDDEPEKEQEQEQGNDEEYDEQGGDGEYEYEQYDGDGFDLNEGQNVDNDDDFMDDEDDGDDFAKKIGLSF